MRKTSRTRSLERLILLPALLFSACTIPGPNAPETEMRSLKGERQWVSVALRDGTKMEISFLRAGDPSAPRALFLHGTPGDASGWADYLIDPPAGFEAIAIDRPGFGETRPVGAMPALIDQAHALAPLLAGRRDNYLVGHSLGAPIAMQAALDFPGRVAGLVILAGSLDPDLEHVLWIQRVGRWRGVEWILPGWARNANRELIELEVHLRSLKPRLSELRCPVVIVHGTEDSLVPYANVPFLLEHLKENSMVEHVRLEGQNHFLPWNSQSVIRASLARVMELGASKNSSR